MTKDIIGDDVLLKQTLSNDNRSYHISSKKIFEELGFKPKHSLKDAIRDMKSALTINSLKIP